MLNNNWLRVLRREEKRRGIIFIVSNLCSVNRTWEKILDIVKLSKMKRKIHYLFSMEESDIKRFVIITSVPFTKTIHEYNFLIILNRVPIENTRTYS